MNSDDKTNGKRQNSDQTASELDADKTLLYEFWDFLMENKIWWITPIVLFLLLVGGFIIYSSLTGDEPLAPFIYTIF